MSHILNCHCVDFPIFLIFSLFISIPPTLCRARALSFCLIQSFTYKKNRSRMFYLQVWFQNRRAKWRRQEKMEAARLGLHDYQLGGLRPGLGGLEPWLGPPLSTLSHALPGFLSHPQAAYASYLATPVVTAAAASLGGCFPVASAMPPSPHTSSSQAAAAGGPTSTAPVSPAASDGRLSPGSSEAVVPPQPPNTAGLSSLPFPFSADHRLSSINALRLKAKEQIELFSKENAFAR